MISIVYCRSVQGAFQALKDRRERTPEQREIIGEVLKAKAGMNR